MESKNTNEEKLENIVPQEQPETAQECSETVLLTKAEFASVKEHIETLQKEKDETVALAQRLQADFENYRKRNSTLKKDSYDEGVRDCIRMILPTLDNYERALSSTNTQGVDEAFVEGVRLVQRTLLSALEKFGFKEIEMGGGFDANLHNAVMQEAVEGKASGEILEVFQKGYEVNGKILRHSMVKVAE